MGLPLQSWGFPPRRAWQTAIMITLIRPSAEADIPAIVEIYSHAVLHGTASFETDPPDLAEMARRRSAITAAGFPYLVAERAGHVVGYAYVSAYRPRLAYRFSVENSIYVAPNLARGGVGRALLEALLALCEADGYRLMVAVIGDSANAASIGLHRSLGFEDAGVLRNVGWKHGRWLDSVFMTRPLGTGAATAPTS